MTGTTIDNRMFYKRLWTLALPISFQSLMLAMVAAFDALMLGRVAQEEMTAVSLATQIQFVQNMFLMSVTFAVLKWLKSRLVKLEQPENM